MTDSTNKKINPQDVKGLPKGACIQSNRYVYFSYAFRSNGKSKHERDYLGTIENGVFVPNDYYKLRSPTRENRPLDNWKDPVQCAKAEQRLKDRQAAQSTLDVPAGEDLSKSVGVTALAVSMLYKSGMVEDVGNAVFNGNVEDTMHTINLGMHAAVTAVPTYFAYGEAQIQKFIGTGCLSSPRASEFHQRIGSQAGDLAFRIGCARGKRVRSNDLLALDGTRIESNSRQIGLAAVGKNKKGGFSQQINFSMLVNATTGMAVGYRLFAGNINDMQTLEEFSNLWQDIGIAQKNTTLLLDRGYFRQDELLKLVKANMRFIVGAKTSLKEIRSIIENDNHLFYSSSHIVPDKDCYGVVRHIELMAPDGDRREAMAYIYRNPMTTMLEVSALKKELKKVQDGWMHGTVEADDKRLDFFKDPVPGEPLELDEFYFDNHCYDMGFFAFVSNRKLPIEQALSHYSLRNEAEVTFKTMMGNLIRTTRVHSTAALNGLVFTSFIGLSILTELRALLRRPDENGVPLSKTYTMHELLKTLQRITLVRDANGGRCRLLNVTEKDRKLVACLGFEGLFDDAEEVNNLLSARRLSMHLDEKRRSREAVE